MAFLKHAVEKGINQSFIKEAEQFGGRIAREVTTTQIRNIFGTIKKMEMGQFDMSRLLLLKPRIAYAKARERKLNELAEELQAAIDAVEAGKDSSEQEERFVRFCQGFEAILAYHRAAGGK